MKMAISMKMMFADDKITKVNIKENFYNNLEIQCTRNKHCKNQKYNNICRKQQIEYR